MKITFERWCIITLLGCLALGVAILPADGARSEDDVVTTPERARLEVWQTRMYARGRHLNDVVSSYIAGVGTEDVRRAFGSSPGKAGDPDVRFSREVPAPVRAAFTTALRDERVERGGWSGRGKVGVLVRIDTVSQIDGRKIGHLAKRGYPTFTRVIAPSESTGDRCIVIVDMPVGEGWSRIVDGKPVGPVHPLLDACGFYDAFGAPGAAIARDLATDRFVYARGYSWVTKPPYKAKGPSTYTFRKWSNETREIRCLAGDDVACANELRGLPGGPWTDPMILPAGVSQLRVQSRELPFPSRLNRMVLELGPQRFARVWKSDKTLEEAYRDETGRSLADFVRREDEKEDGVYLPGPWAPLTSTMLTLVMISAGVAVTLRFAGRPRVA